MGSRWSGSRTQSAEQQQILYTSARPTKSDSERSMEIAAEATSAWCLLVHLPQKARTSTRSILLAHSPITPRAACLLVCVCLSPSLVRLIVSHSSMESFEYSETTTSPPNQLTPQARELLMRECFGETVVYACTPRFWPVWRRTVYGIAVMSLMFVIAIVSLCVFFAIEEYDSSKRSQLWFLSVMGSIIVIFPLSIPCGAYSLWLYYRTYFALTPDEILLNKVRATSLLPSRTRERTDLADSASLSGRLHTTVGHLLDQTLPSAIRGRQGRLD